MTVTLQDTNGVPESGLPVYAFDGGSYTGYNKTTGEDGKAIFTLPQGDYRFRADKNGTQFWSGDENHCTVPGCVSAVVTTTIPLTVTVKNEGGTPQEGLHVYAFDGTSYTGYHKTTDAAGEAVFTLPQGNYRFRADMDGEQYWSGAENHCPVPGCLSAAVTVPGGIVAETRVITYTYDPLGRLTSSDYSTTEQFEYAYDAVGNRTVMTSTTPISGTVVTRYAFDAANRLTSQIRSDGREYTYEWSDKGELLAETTQGQVVRSFVYDVAGRMVAATVFTLTTRFSYDGLGNRHVVTVDGHGSTTNVLDLTVGGRILSEVTDDGTTHYLYGHGCLGELRDDDWLYYLNDGEGLVRQGTDDRGVIASTWLFDPDGGVLEGPEGPVSHLVCGGVYDWSTGLIYKGGRYFDPSLGIWLLVGGMIIVQSWPGRKKKRGGIPWLGIFLLVAGLSGTLAACGTGGQIDPEIAKTTCIPNTPLPPGTPTPTPTPPTPWPPTPTPSPGECSAGGSELFEDCFYDWVKATNYANAHWEKPYENPAGDGPDCTNFVSTVLHEGGLKTTNEWKPELGWGPWVNTGDLLEYLDGKFSVLRFNEPTPREGYNDFEHLRNTDKWNQFISNHRGSILEGDIVFFESTKTAILWDHAAIVVGWGPETYKATNESSSVWKPLIVDHDGAVPNDLPRSIDDTYNNLSCV